MNRRKRRKEAAIRGYFTVEAALIISLTMILYLLLIYVMIYQYNRCVLEQETGIIALRCSNDPTMNNNPVAEVSQKQSEIMFHSQQVECYFEKGSVLVEQEGVQNTAFGEMHISTSFKNSVKEPMIIVRMIKKLIREQ